MRKILRLLLIPIFSILLFVLSVSPSHAVTCSTDLDSVEAGTLLKIESTDLQPGGSYDVRLSTYGGDPINLAGKITDIGNPGDYKRFYLIPNDAIPTEYQIQFDLTGSGGWEACTSGNIQITESSASSDDPSTRNLTSDGPAQIRDIVIVIGNIIKLLAPIAAVAFLAMIIYGGFQLITSGGDPKAAAGARNTFTYAVLGIILVVVVWLLLLLIENVTGAKVTEVNIP